MDYVLPGCAQVAQEVQINRFKSSIDSSDIVANPIVPWALFMIHYTVHHYKYIEQESARSDPFSHTGISTFHTGILCEPLRASLIIA